MTRRRFPPPWTIEDKGFGPTLGDERVDPMPNVGGVGIRGALVMPDGRILSWYDDGTLRLWDVKTGRQVGLAMRLAEGGRHCHGRACDAGSAEITKGAWPAGQVTPAAAPSEALRASAIHLPKNLSLMLVK